MAVGLIKGKGFRVRNNGEFEITEFKLAESNCIYYYIINRLNTCYDQDGAVYLRTRRHSRLLILQPQPSFQKASTQKHRQLYLFHFNYLKCCG